MERKILSLVYMLVVLLLTACGGGSSNGSSGGLQGGSSTSSSGSVAEPVLNSIEIEIDQTEMLNTDRVRFQVLAYYSNGAIVDVTDDSVLSLSPRANSGSLIDDFWMNTWYYEPGEAGQFTLSSEFGGQMDSVVLTVEYYVTGIEYALNARILPLGASVPVLARAEALVSGGPRIPLLDLLEYESLDQDIAVIEPKTDSLVMDVYRNPNIGHVTTRALGSFDMSFSIVDMTFSETFEVLPFRLVDSRLTPESINFRYDLKIDELGDSFFLSGKPIAGKDHFVLSQYSLAEDRWLDEVYIPRPEETAEANGFTTLEISENKIIIWWHELLANANVLIYNRADGTSEYLSLDVSDGSGSAIALDNDQRVILCKSKWSLSSSECYTYVDGQGWNEGQTLPFHIGEIKLSEQNIGFAVESEIDTDGKVILTGIRFVTSDTGLSVVDTAEIDSGDITLRETAYCQHQIVSKTGNMVCLGDFGEDYLHLGVLTISYHPTPGWQLEVHLQPDELYRGNLRPRAGVADNGDILLMIPDPLNLEYFERYYTTVSGWGARRLVFNTIAGETAALDHDPVYTAAGWKQFIEVNNGIRTRNPDGIWSNVEVFRGVRAWIGGGWGLGSTAIEGFIAPDGNYILSWINPWQLRTPEHGLRSNTLTYYKPARND